MQEMVVKFGRPPVLHFKCVPLTSKTYATPFPILLYKKISNNQRLSLL